MTEGVTLMFIRLWLLIVFVLILLGIVLTLILGGDEGVLFAEGDAISLPPAGDLVAVRKGDRHWTVYDGGGRPLHGFESIHPPLWTWGEEGRCMAYTEGEVVKKIKVGTSDPPAKLFRDDGALPYQALRGGRILLTHWNDEGIHAFTVHPGSPGRDEEALRFDFKKTPAAFVIATLDGVRIACTVPEGAFYRIDVLRYRIRTGTYERERIIEDANYPELFWSWDGRILLFSSSDGGVELYDFSKQERRWITESSFAPCSLLPFQAHFGPQNDMIFLETMDEHGYWQVITFEVATAKETRFSSGWVDHYGHVLSKNGHFMAYRQGELPSRERGGDAWRGTESIQIFDFHENRGYRIASRSMKKDSFLAGPFFSGDLCHLYYEREGRIFRYALPK